MRPEARGEYADGDGEDDADIDMDLSFMCTTRPYSIAVESDPANLLFSFDCPIKPVNK